MKMTAGLVLLLSVGTSLLGGDLPSEVQAKFIKIIANSSGLNGTVACKDSGVTGAITATGCKIDPSAKVAYGNTEGEVKAMKSAGKLVICPKVELLSVGGAIAIIEEGGHPAIYLSVGNIAASGVPLSDAIMKLGKKL